MGANTRILAREFEYLEPKTRKEALEFLKNYEHVKILAGGTDLMVKLKIGANIKVDYMMNIKEIADLNYVRRGNDQVLIGAGTVLSTAEKNELVATRLPALYEAIKSMAATAVRNMGTVAGNLCNSSPAGDTIPPLIAYGAKMLLARAEGFRVIPVSDFITGPGKNILEKAEMVMEIIIPLPPAHSGAAFIKKSRVKADISKINTAVYLERDKDLVKNCRIVMGSVAATVIRIDEAEAALKGRILDQAAVSEAARIAAEQIRPIDDTRSTIEYRKDIARVIVEDALLLAWQRTGGIRQ